MLFHQFLLEQACENLVSVAYHHMLFHHIFQLPTLYIFLPIPCRQGLIVFLKFFQSLGKQDCDPFNSPYFSIRLVMGERASSTKFLHPCLNHFAWSRVCIFCSLKYSSLTLLVRITNSFPNRSGCHHLEYMANISLSYVEKCSCRSCRLGYVR